MKVDAVKVEFHLLLKAGNSTQHHQTKNTAGVKYDNKTPNRKIPLAWNIREGNILS